MNFFLRSINIVLTRSDSHHSRLYMLIKPKHSCLQECLLLGVRNQPVRQVAANSEPVRNAGVEVDLVWNLDALQNDLGLVALLCRELPASRFLADSSASEPQSTSGLTGRGNAKRPLDRLQLLVGDPARVGDVPSVRHTRLQEARDVLGPEAVTHRADAPDAVLVLQLADDSLDHGIDLVRRVLGAPGVHVEAAGAVQRDGVPMEEVGHDGEVAVGGELVGDELRVEEAACR